MATERKTMSKRKILWLVGMVVLALALAGAGYLYWKGEQRRTVATASIPHRPALQGRSAELINRITACEQRIRLGEDVLPSLAELASLYHGNGFFTEAAHCYQGLLRIDPRNPRWSHLFANILAGSGQLDDAVILWRRTLSLKDDYTPAQIHLADALLKLNHSEEANKVYNHVLKREPENPYALLGLSRIDMEAGRWGSARDRLEIAVAKSDYTIGYDLLVTVCEHLGENQRAEAIRARVKAAGSFIDIPDPWLRDTFLDCYDSFQMSLAAGTADRQGDTVAAVNFAERAITLDPKNGYYYVQAYQFYMRLGSSAKALQLLRTATVQDPNCADAWHTLALALRDSGQTQEAYHVTITGLSHCPDSPSLHFVRGEYLVAAGQFEQAVPEFLKYAAVFTDEGSPHLQLAQIYFQLNRLPEGLAELEKALLSEPEYPPALVTLAFYSINTHDELRAQKWMQRVKAQPRIKPQERSQLEQAYQQQFGRAPY
jgi:tetratricopeptide (TPR) repeat protein